MLNPQKTDATAATVSVMERSPFCADRGAITVVRARQVTLAYSDGARHHHSVTLGGVASVLAQSGVEQLNGRSVCDA